MYIITIRKLQMSEQSENFQYTSVDTILILNKIIYDTDTILIL